MLGKGAVSPLLLLRVEKEEVEEKEEVLSDGPWRMTKTMGGKG